MKESIQSETRGRDTTIWMNITHGFQARMLLRSEIAETILDSGGRLIVCSPNADEDYFRSEFSDERMQLVKMPTRTHRLEARLSAYRQYLLMHPALGGTLNYKREVMRQSRPIRYRMTRIANSALGRISLLRKSYMQLERRAFPGREFDPLLKKQRPDLLVTGTPGFNEHDVHALRSAKRLGIPTATVMLSWDNLTSKGYMNGIPDHLLVWSDLMADEAESLHEYPRRNVHWTGAAQFDVYHDARSRLDDEAWRHNHDVPLDAFLITYGTINPGICPHEVSILRSIIRKINQSSFDRPIFLWIRLHPQVVRGPWKAALQPFRDLESDHVRVESPPVQSESLQWDLPKSDTQHLMQLLSASDLVATTSSTLSIDAACAGTPIVNVFFDGDEIVQESSSVARFQHYTHYAKILETGGIFKTYSPEEFASAIKRYMNDPLADADARQAIVEQQLHVCDGMAGKRTGSKLLELASMQANHDISQSAADETDSPMSPRKANVAGL